MTTLTSVNASLGHSVNQSITVLFTNPGKLRHRSRSESPMGDMASTTCMFALHRDMKNRHPSSRVTGTLFSCNDSRMAFTNESFSSSEKSAGTLPVVSMLLIDSKNPSSTT